MAKTPSTTDAAAPDQVQELQSALGALKAQVAELTAQHGAEVAVLKAQVAELEAERIRQHGIIKGLYERLDATPAARAAEPKVLMARHVRKYGE